MHMAVFFETNRMFPWTDPQISGTRRSSGADERSGLFPVTHSRDVAMATNFGAESAKFARMHMVGRK